MCKESVHVLFDESNSLIENCAQDEDFELGLAKKGFSPTHEETKNSQEGLGAGPVSKEEGQGSEQTGGTPVEPCLEQNDTNRPETGTKSSAETEPIAGSERESSNNQAEGRPLPRTWKYKKSHPP